MLNRARKRRGTDKLYHTTRASLLPTIEREGLSPELAGRWIYLALDAAQSKGYAAFFPGHEVVLLEVDFAALDPELLGPDDLDLQDILEQRGDDRAWNDVDWRESLRLSGQATYDGAIPPEAIRVKEQWRAID